MSQKSQNKKNLVKQEIAALDDDSLAKLLETTSPDLLRKMSPELIRELNERPIAQITRHVASSTTFSGPLPPPEILAQYNEIIPNGAEMIFDRMNKQSDHRMALEKEVIPKQQAESGRGQIFSFTLGVLGIISATSVGIWGDWRVGVATAAGSLGVLTVSFLFGKGHQHKQLKEKSKA